MKKNSAIHCALACVAVLGLAVLAHALTPEVAGAGAFALSMAVVQSTYAERMAAGLPGMIADMNNSEVETRNCESVAGIAFGVAVGQGAADKGAIALPATAAAFVGVSVRDVTVDHNTPDKYAENDNMGVMTKGTIWVTVDGNVAAGQNVTFSTATGLFGTIAADGTHLLATNAKWDTSASSGAVARLRLTGQNAGA